MPNQENSQSAFENFPLADADSCVKCGLCLPHCPTYMETGIEGDSPRGRIALMQGLAQGVLAAEGRTTAHLDGCLTCRACETVCPASVPYGKLIDQGRAGLWKAGHRPGLRWRLLAWWRRSPARINTLGRLLRLFSASRLRSLLRRFPSRQIRRQAGLAGPAGRWPVTGLHPATGTRRGRVGLFLGCIARPLDADVATATIEILNYLGFDVNLPANQGCCGAMDQHAGDLDSAARLLADNETAFVDDEILLTTASGCGIQLAEHSALAVRDAADFIADALANALREHRVQLREKSERILVHSPCTLKQMGATTGVSRLLEQLPGAEIVALPHAHCCGAAGAYLFEQPEMSETLGRATWAVAETQGADVLATSNVGCALQLREIGAGENLPVCHPLQLLAARLL